MLHRQPGATAVELMETTISKLFQSLMPSPPQSRRGRSQALRRVLVAVLGIIVAGTTPARGETIHASPHLEHTTWILGAKLVQFNAWNPGDGESPNETVTGVGGGLLVERTLVEGWLEIELSASGVATGDGVVVPIDVLFKKSFELGRLNPYFGIGPSISIDIVDGEAEASAGCAFAVGSYIWVSEHVGIDVDLDYALVSNHGAAQELALSVGPVLRF